MSRICLVTPHHISFQPRTLREADSLSEAGYDVRVVSCQVDPTLTEYDRRLMGSRTWTLQSVGLQRHGPSRRAWMAESVRSRMYQWLFEARMRTDRIATRSYIRGFDSLLGMAISEPADWFIAHTQSALPIAAAAAQHWNARLGFDCEDLLAENGTDRREVIRVIERRYLPLCDYVSTPSRCLGNKLIQTYGGEQPLVLYNVSPLRLAEGMTQPRRRQGRPEIRLHWFGQTIGSGRGIEEAVEAMGLLADESIELHLRGRVTSAFRDQLESLAASNGVREKLVFHPPVFPEDTVRMMGEFDVGLALERPDHANYSLAATNKLLAYLLAGLAVAASETPGHRELLEQAPAVGFLYPAGRSDCLANGLRRWIDDREALLTAQEAAWNAARERFSWDVEKEKFFAALNSPLK